MGFFSDSGRAFCRFYCFNLDLSKTDQEKQTKFNEKLMKKLIPHISVVLLLTFSIAAQENQPKKINKVENQLKGQRLIPARCGSRRKKSFILFKHFLKPIAVFARAHWAGTSRCPYFVLQPVPRFQRRGVFG
jgi:hypothetical protein